MPKIRSTQRTVQVSTPRLTPPSTAGFGASGRATQQLGNEISKFAGVFDAFAQAEEKNQAANLQSDFYQLQIDSDKQLADFGNEHKGDGNSYFQGAGSIFDNNGQKFVDKYSGNSKLQTRAKTMVQGAKVQYQRKAIAKGQQIQHDRAIIKSTEISASIRGGMLTPENLKEGGLGIVQESTDKYFKIVDGLPMPEKAKTVVKQKFVKDAAKQVEDQADPSALLKWRSEIGKKLEKEGASEKPINADNELKASRASQRAVKMIYGEEGLRLKAYLDPVGVPTIGYGHTKGVKLGQKITKEQAVQLAKQDIKQFENAVDRNIKVPLSQNQYDALVSFAFNLGEGNLKKISGDINAGNFAKAAKRMLSFNKARDRRTGQMRRLPGLVSRRKREANLFMQKGGGKVAGFKQEETLSLDMQIAGAINWKNVEKRHEETVTQQVVQQVKGKPAVEQELMRDTLHDLQEKSPQNKEIAIRLKAVEDYQKKQTKGLKNDPLKFADDEGVVDVPSLIGQKDIMKSIGERVDIAHKVSDIYQTEPRYLRQEEKAFISKHVNELPANEKLEFLALLDKGAKGKTSKILSELNDVDPNLAHVGGLMLSGRNEAATLAMQGMDIMKDKSLKAVTESIKTSDVTAAYNEVIGNAFGPDTIKAAGPFIGTAKAIAATLMVQGGKTPQEAIEEGLRMATGQKEIDGEQYGGVIEFNDQKILIHPDHKADDVLNLFDLLTSGSTESQAGRGVIKRSLFSDPRGAFDFFLRKDGINPTSPVTHRPVTAEDMHDAQFVSVGPGKVLILIDGVPLKDTRSAQNLGNGMQAYTQDYVLDLSQNLGELVDLIDLER